MSRTRFVHGYALTPRAIMVSLMCGAALIGNPPLPAAELRVRIADAKAQSLERAVIWIAPARSASAAMQASRATSPAIMDQIDKQFVPDILAVRVGTAVAFPNSDSVAHQVYSFSPTKRFSLPLYRGKPYPPVVFDRPGIVTLGCNIHDHMVGYIVVVDTPYFGHSDAQGQLVLRDVPSGEYRVSVWHPRFTEPPIEQTLSLQGDTNIELRIDKPLKPAPRKHTDKRLRDY